MHDPEIAAIVRDVLGKLRAWWDRAAQHMLNEGRLPAGTDVNAAGSVLSALIPGFLVHYLILGGTDADTLRRGLRALLRPEVLTPDLEA
ncbi:MAG TPA: TetR family transcriptional regulator C-terminal domain-containing protein [Trebonia sp.]